MTSKKDKLTELANLRDKMIKLGEQYNAIARGINSESRIGVIHSQYDQYPELDDQRCKKADKKQFIGDRVDYLGKDSCIHYIHSCKESNYWFPSTVRCW